MLYKLYKAGTCPDCKVVLLMHLLEAFVDIYGYMDVRDEYVETNVYSDLMALTAKFPK